MNTKGIVLLAAVILVVLYATYRYMANEELQGGTVQDQQIEN